MGRAAERKQAELVDDFLVRWNRLAELIGHTAEKQSNTQEEARDFLILSGEIAERIVPLANSLGLEKTFIQQVVDFLEDNHNLLIYRGMQQFQVTLIKEKWNAILLEINSHFAIRR